MMCNQDSDFHDPSTMTATSVHSKEEMEYDSHVVKASSLEDGLDHMRLPFAYKLHILLSDVEANGCEHIISWVENENAFQIHDRQTFEKLIQPRYFRQSKIASFIRQCYMYGFSKVEGGPSHGSYVHPDFCKNDQAKALTIQRQSSTRSRRHYYHVDSAKSSSRTISSPSLTTTAGKGKLLSIEESPTKSDSSNNVIIGRDSSPLPSTLSNTFSWDHAALPVSHSCDWQSEHQQTMFQEDHLSTPDDESLFEPRPIELMLMSSCQSISLNTPSW